MATKQEYNLYFVNHIKSAKAPVEGDTQQWWQYEIKCRISEKHSVVGYRAGKKEKVQEAVEKIVDSINSRTRGKTSAALRLAHSSPKSISVASSRSGIKNSYF